MRSSARTYFNQVHHFIAHPLLTGCRKTLFVIPSPPRRTRNLFFHIKLRFLIPINRRFEMTFLFIHIRVKGITFQGGFEMTDEKNFFNRLLRNFLVGSLSTAFILPLTAILIFGNFYNPYLYEYGLLLLTFITGFISLAQSRRRSVLICTCIGSYSVIQALLHVEIKY